MRFNPSKSYTAEEYTSMLEATCIDINSRMNATPGMNSMMSGSTGIIVLLHNDQIICANVGDSRAGLTRFDVPQDIG